MTTQTNPYIRIYRRIRDDSRFEHVYSCDVCLAAYVRLLIDADACYPTAASFPRSLKAHARKYLMDAGIIEPRPADCYIVHGLTNEREGRSAQARANVAHRYTGPTAVEQPNNNGTTGTITCDLLARAPNQTEPNQAEPNRATASAYPDGDKDCLDTYHALSMYRPWGQFSGDKLKGAIGEYGNDVVDRALFAEHALDLDRKTLLDRTLARLARDADRSKTAKETAAKAPVLLADGTEGCRKCHGAGTEGNPLMSEPRGARHRFSPCPSRSLPGTASLAREAALLRDGK